MKAWEKILFSGELLAELKSLVNQSILKNRNADCSPIAGDRTSGRSTVTNDCGATSQFY
ncbi:hypothetical protein [Microcoleus sp. herbarium14]|uniref:hypothetical protein n=1 Tax=Microcoleus sp. herbarium14 TaxID=3055439 RepID=UPI002FD327C4